MAHFLAVYFLAWEWDHGTPGRTAVTFHGTTEINIRCENGDGRVLLRLAYSDIAGK